MPIIILYTGIWVFVFCLFTHVLIWKLVNIKKEIITLVIIFLLLPLVIVVCLAFIGSLLPLETFAICVLTIALSLAYLQTYPALGVRIPIFGIIRLIESRAGDGISKEEIIMQFEESDELVNKKISELQNDLFIIVEEERLRLTYIGKMAASFCIIYRKLLGLDIGKG